MFLKQSKEKHVVNSSEMKKVPQACVKEICNTQSDHVHLIRLFRNCLHPQFLQKILFGETIPKMTEGWYEKAIQFDTNY